MTNHKTEKSDTAFILAAGFGARLKPYTDYIPKPMVIVRGKPIIDHILEQLKTYGIRKAIINLHYLGDTLKNHLRSYKDIELIFSEEPEILDTGGGVMQARPYIGSKPFFLINGDAYWESQYRDALEQLSMQWNPAIMDILLLLQPVRSMTLTQGVGDYTLLKNGQAVRQVDKSGDMMFTGIRMVNPEILKDVQERKFSFLHFMDMAEKRGRLYAVPHQGLWHHISTPQDLINVNAALNKSGTA